MPKSTQIIRLKRISLIRNIIVIQSGDILPTICPRCGQRAEDWFVYCKYCGFHLKQESEKKKPVTIKVELEEPVKPIITTKGNEIPKIERRETRLEALEPVKIEKIPDDVKRNLIGRGKTYLIEVRLRKLNRDYETLKTRQLVGEITEEELEKRSEPLWREINDIKKTLKEMGAVEQLEVELLLAEKETQIERKKKLEELLIKGEIRETIYQKLVSEYDAKLKQAEKKLKDGIQQMEKWLVSLNAEMQDLLDQQEMLMAKMKIGDLPVKEYENQKKELETKIKDNELAIQFLEGVIERFKVTEE
jgi:chromosome segregation ATPase